MLRKRVRYMNRLTDVSSSDAPVNHTSGTRKPKPKPKQWILKGQEYESQFTHHVLRCFCLSILNSLPFTQRVLNGGKFSTCVFGLVGNEGYESFSSRVSPMN